MICRWLNATLKLCYFLILIWTFSVLIPNFLLCLLKGKHIKRSNHIIITYKICRSEIAKHILKVMLIWIEGHYFNRRRVIYFKNSYIITRYISGTINMISSFNKIIHCDHKKPRDKLMFDLQVASFADSLPFNRLTMLSIVLLSHFVCGKYFINLYIYIYIYIKRMLKGPTKVS